MKEITGNLWDYFAKPGYIVCITTNGTIKANGECVMGRGCAAEAKKLIPQVAAYLGNKIKREGNRVNWLTMGLLSFPVKHNWWEQADIELIKRSAEQLAYEAQNVADKWYILPRPGCGNGRLKWEDVKKVIEPILPDNVWVISYGK